jgi:hypothetical protein
VLTGLEYACGEIEGLCTDEQHHAFRLEYGKLMLANGEVDFGSGKGPRIGKNAGRSGRASCGPNSFTSDTLVLMVDGTTDPETGESGPQTVTATIIDRGQKALTDNHPFWSNDRDEWVSAADLDVGNSLRSPEGAEIWILATRTRSITTTVHNLTVGGIHTYYVLIGDLAVLVHNTGGPGSPDKGEKGTRRLVHELRSNGYNVLGTEISAQAANGVNVRFDVVAERDGVIHVFDAKNGPRAMFTKGQGRNGGYAAIEASGGHLVRAQRRASWSNGQLRPAGCQDRRIW